MVYFFNPDDLDRLDISPFERVFLVVPEENIYRYAEAFGGRLERKKNMIVHLEQLANKSVSETTQFAPREILRTNNAIFLVHEE